jgi:hypothetical protein
VAIVAIWLTLMMTYALIAKPPAAEGWSCLFRKATGVPCATCGSTRAAFSVWRGDVVGAVAHNPMMSLGVVALITWLLLRVGFGRSVRLDLTAGQRAMAWTVVAGLFVANWAWVIWHDAG